MFNIPIPDETPHVAIDRNHLALIFGLVVAHKPSCVLELGIGSGAATRVITAGLRYNGTLPGARTGTLVSVDNCYDWGGNPPHHFLSLLTDISSQVLCDEALFMKTEGAGHAGGYDMVLVDSDHPGGGKKLDDYLSMTASGGLLIMHDVCNTDYPGLCEIPVRLIAMGMSPMVFSRSTLPGERCSRGLLVVRKP